VLRRAAEALSRTVWLEEGRLYNYSAIWAEIAGDDPFDRARNVSRMRNARADSDELDAMFRCIWIICSANCENCS
jgi:hypothetical protein